MIVYDLAADSATWETPPRCSPGSIALANACKERWPMLLIQTMIYGCYNRRKTAGGSKSIHGDGRAIDIGIGWTPTPEQKATLDECTNHLAANASHLGVQRIIYNRRIWDRRGWRAYNDNAHFDHAHVEQTIEAAWTNPLPIDQARAVISPPPAPPPPPPMPEFPLPDYIPLEDDMPLYFRFAGAVYALKDSGGWRPVDGVELYKLARRTLESVPELNQAELDALTRKNPEG